MVLQPQVCRNHRSAHKSVEFTTPVLTFQYSILVIIQIRNKMKSVFQTYSPCFTCKLPYQIVPGHRQRYTTIPTRPQAPLHIACGEADKVYADTTHAHTYHAHMIRIM